MKYEESKISGVKTPRDAFSADTRDFILGDLWMAREVFADQVKLGIGGLDKNTLLFGSRFRSDERILHILESNLSEQEFLSSPEQNILFALYDAASADYHYAYEKDWGDNA